MWYHYFSVLIVGQKNWEVLWSDLQELYETENPRNHFMGSIVTIPTKSVPEGVTKYLLIDGQQRITTIYLILMALGDIYIKIEVKQRIMKR